MSFQQTVARQRSLCVSALRKQPMHEPLPMTLLFLLGWRAQSTLKSRWSFAGTLEQTLRYGENPHQSASILTVLAVRAATATQHQGKELSYNNINDTDAAFELVAGFDPADGPARNHQTCKPMRCGARCDLVEAYKAAFDLSHKRVRGIVAFNQELDEATAQEMAGIFTEVVIVLWHRMRQKPCSQLKRTCAFY